MATYNFPGDADHYNGGVHSLAFAPLNAGPDSHTINLNGFPAESFGRGSSVAYIIEALGISLDASDDCTITVTDPDANGPTLQVILSGATTPPTFRQLAGEWVPQGSTVEIATTTGINVRSRLAVREDKEG